MSTKTAYDKAFNSWVKSQKNTIKQVELNIQNSENMVKVHTEALEIQRECLAHETGLLEEALKNSQE